MKIERKYEENGVKITRISMKKPTSKIVIKGKSKRISTSKPPSSVKCSSVYSSNYKGELSGMTRQDSMSTNKQGHQREWGAQ